MHHPYQLQSLLQEPTPLGPFRVGGVGVAQSLGHHEAAMRSTVSVSVSVRVAAADIAKTPAAEAEELWPWVLLLGVEMTLTAPPAIDHGNSMSARRSSTLPRGAA